jgi:prepilin-type N-terminal cleavage/methylation domain-containing protein
MNADNESPIGFPRNARGFSLVETMVVVGIVGVMALAMMTMQSNQVKSNNYLEFQLKRTQLQGVLLGQFLKDPNNCACLFAGATAFPAAGAATLPGTAPTQIGLYTSAAPACGTPAQFFIDAAGIDGLKATSIRLQNITPTSDPNIYTGAFNIGVQSTKDVLGPKELPISIPVSVATSPSGANVVFNSCSSSAVGASAFVPKKKSCVDNFQKCWTAQFTNNECAPPACATGETNIYQGCQSASDGGSCWTNVTCNRLCYSGSLPSGYNLEYYCSFGIPDGAPVAVACTPSVCPGATTDAGINCRAQRIGSNLVGGYCVRTCIAN